MYIIKLAYPDENVLRLKYSIQYISKRTIPQIDCYLKYNQARSNMW